MNKILIFTKRDIRTLSHRIIGIVNTDKFTLTKSEGQIVTEHGTLIIIRQLSESARGYRANVVLYDGKFTNEEKEFMQRILTPNGMFRKLQINKLKE